MPRRVSISGTPSTAGPCSIACPIPFVDPPTCEQTWATANAGIHNASCALWAIIGIALSGVLIRRIRRIRAAGRGNTNIAWMSGSLLVASLCLALRGID